MKILLLSSAQPGDFSYGAAQRDNYIRDALGRVGSVDTINIFPGELKANDKRWTDDRILNVRTTIDAGRKARMRDFLMLRRLVAKVESEGNYDFIVARHFEKAALVPIAAHGKLIVDGDDYRRAVGGQPWTIRIELAGRLAMIRAIARRARHVWLSDPRDRQSLPDLDDRVSILPNAAKRVPANRKKPAPKRYRILMVGLFVYPPNAEGLLWFTRNVLPKIVAKYPDAALHAIGKFYQKELRNLSPLVTMRGFVDRLGPEYAAAEVVICPIRTGSGTQIKVIEALMHERPVVVSDFSFRGFSEVLIPNEHVLVAHSAEDWVRQIDLVFKDNARAAAFARAGHEAAEAAYTDEAFQAQVVDTLEKLAANAGLA